VMCWVLSYGDHLSRDVADAASPARGRLVEDVVDPEPGVARGERVEVLPEKDVRLGDVGEDEIHLGLVPGSATTDDGLDDLEHGRDPGTASDHAEVAHHVRGVDEGALGAAHLDGLADGEAGEVLGDVAGGVRLDQEVKVAGLVVARDRGVGAHDLLAGSVGLGDGGTDGDVLANGQTEDVLRGGQLEPVASRDRRR
jgi:hypothetical protein